MRRTANHVGSRSHSGILAAVLVVVMIIASGAAGVIITRWWGQVHPTVITRTRTRTIVQTTAADVPAMKRVVRSLKKARPTWTDVQIASIAGNVYGESGGTVDSLEVAKGGDDVGSMTNAQVQAWADANSAGIGILQWTGTRADALVAHADSAGTRWDDLSTQVDYLITEVEGTGVWTGPTEKDWLSATDVSTATKDMMTGFVRPDDPSKSWSRRLDAALAIYAALQRGSL